ncbi:HlyD family secretion protein [Planctomycetes bacterium Poly30]|uniref:HlyD family secretion protein n=1 Tax=Saltatorellus ferox TaxID=2528018 RepID=A0A518EQ08_9BACT|nr:HlyD family secretion protein [Planctomycetes bacterium Poly30]
MMTPTLLRQVLLGCLVSLSLWSCDQRAESTPDEHDHAHDAAGEAANADANRIAVPPAVRQNLGITFVRVERRAIESTLRVPGRFELLPSAHDEYRTAIAGRVELHVRELERVEAGQPLYTLSSPSLHGLQERLAETEAAVLKLQSEIDAYASLMSAHAQHEARLEESIQIQESRVERLEQLGEAGGGRVTELLTARGALATARADLAGAHEKEAEIRVAQTKNQVEVDGLSNLRMILLGSLAADTGLTRAALLEEVTGPDGKVQPRWRALTEIVVMAQNASRVESLGVTSGTWVDERALILTTVRPELLRFHGMGLQSDLGALDDGLMARITPPGTSNAVGSVSLQETMSGPLQIGLGGNSQNRTIDLFVEPEALLPWARPGVTAQMEIVLRASESEELAIPLAAVRQDGLHSVFFRRDPKNPAEVIRVEGDFGANDGRWISVLSGLRDGDEVVLDGSFQLMLATSGTMQKGGHFHADGTFHEGED